MLILYGNTKVASDWEVVEKEGCGYSRIYYVHEGQAYYTGDNQSCDLVAGRVYVMPNNIPYRIVRNKEKDFRCTYLHVDIPMVNVGGVIELLPQKEESLRFHFYKEVSCYHLSHSDCHSY